MSVSKTTARTVKALHEKVTGALKSSLAYARQAGERLSKVSASCPAKEFVKWVTKEVGISESTAYNYVRIYKHWREVEGEDCYVSALKSLRKSRKPKEEAPAPVLTPWQAALVKKMDQFGVKGRLDNVILFLESYGVTEPKAPLAA